MFVFRGDKGYMFKKFLKKLHLKLYYFHKRKADKYFFKAVGAKRYLPSKKQLEELKFAFEKGETHCSFDTTSLYPSVMRTGKFPMG